MSSSQNKKPGDPVKPQKNDSTKHKFTRTGISAILPFPPFMSQSRAFNPGARVVQSSAGFRPNPAPNTNLTPESQSEQTIPLESGKDNHNNGRSGRYGCKVMGNEVIGDRPNCPMHPFGFESSRPSTAGSGKNSSYFSFGPSQSPGQCVISGQGGGMMGSGRPHTAGDFSSSLSQAFRTKVSLGEGQGHFPSPNSGPTQTCTTTLPSSPLSKEFQPIWPYLCWSSPPQEEIGFHGPPAGAGTGGGELGIPMTPTIPSSSSPSIFGTCGQVSPIPIHLCFGYLKGPRKIGEGVFGEVYTGLFSRFPVPNVYKVVAIEGKVLVNKEKQKTFTEIEQEVIISKQLNSLQKSGSQNFTDAFVKLLNVRVCCGKYPRTLIDAWQIWDKYYKSENDCPNFQRDQLYIVFEYEHAGRDMESYMFDNAQQAFSVLLQVGMALGVAEAELKFEHRDLHWGNVLVSRIQNNDQFVTFRLNGVYIQVPNYGVKGMLIDFTISRLTHPETNKTIFSDLAEDEDQFTGSNDYQFEIYRMMKEENGNIWHTFRPKTNIFWLHYLADKLITMGRYREVGSQTHSTYLDKLLLFREVIKEFSSCQDLALKYAADPKLFDEVGKWEDVVSNVDNQ